MSKKRQFALRLRWQSRAVLFVATAFACGGVGLRFAHDYLVDPTAILLAIAFGALLAILTSKLRAATPAAALAGGVITAALYLATPGLRTALWPLLALLLLTLAATRFGRARKRELGVAEGPRGRNAAQVAANLGPAVIASVGLSLVSAFTVFGFIAPIAMRLAIAAALAEAAADTLSSEIGEVLGGEPRLITTLRRVPAGTDGAISLDGTIAGLTAAGIVAAVASLSFGLTEKGGAVVALAAVAGLFIDSLLGAILERRGWLNNDAVNFLSSLAAAILAALFQVSR